MIIAHNRDDIPSGRSNDLPRSIACVLANRCLNHTVHDLRLDLRHFPQTSGLQCWVCIPHDCYRVEGRRRVIVSYRCPACNIWVQRFSSLEVREGSEKVLCSAWCVYDSSAPDIGRRVSSQVEASDYAEVVLSAFQSSEEVRS